MSHTLFTVSEACTTLKIGKTKIYQELNSGRLKAKKYGRKTLIPENEISKWLENLPLYRNDN